MNRLSSQFPQRPPSEIDSPQDSGRIGVNVQVLTVDGNDYFPYVMNVFGGSPASKAGIHKEDAIVAIDGISTANRPLSEVMRLIRGEVGTEVTLKVWRGDPSLSTHEREFSVRRITPPKEE